jgi:hypothetical protein
MARAAFEATPLVLALVASRAVLAGLQALCSAADLGWHSTVADPRSGRLMGVRFSGKRDYERCKSGEQQTTHPIPL